MVPPQGYWTAREYLAVETNHLVEFDDGFIEVLPLPKKTHQLIVAFHYELLKAFAGGNGRVFFAPCRLRVSSDKFREADVVYLTPEQDARAGEDYTGAAELLVEVVSEDDPERDYVTKRRDSAAAGVPEYWIVDRFERQVLVLWLEDGRYVEYGRFLPGQRATSHCLGGFSVGVDDVFAQGAGTADGGASSRP